MVTPGIETFLDNLYTYKNRRIALIVNQTSVTGNMIYLWEKLQREGIKIKRIFSPEHGIFGTEQDQIAVETQPSPNFEVVSLYGSSYDSLMPIKTLLEDIDLVVFDIQDVGSRYYTYVNTMALFMESIESKDIQFVVLDRPNPLGGIRLEGPVLKEDYKSFVGMLHVPIVHGMTIGELSLFYKHIKKLDIDLSIVKLRGWKREMLYKDTGLIWIPPSPNMPTEDTAYIYPGSCLLEGTNISEGRGTTTPFKIIGASYIEPESFSEYLNSMKIKGVYFRPVYFKPTFHKYSDETIGGIFIHITDIKDFKSFYTGIAIIKAASDMYENNFRFLKGYEFNTTHYAFDLLTGSSTIREMIMNGRSMNDLQNIWSEEENNFLDIKKEYQLYDE